MKRGVKKLFRNKKKSNYSIVTLRKYLITPVTSNGKEVSGFTSYWINSRVLPCRWEEYTMENRTFLGGSDGDVYHYFPIASLSRIDFKVIGTRMFKLYGKDIHKEVFTDQEIIDNGFEEIITEPVKQDKQEETEVIKE